MSIKFECPCGHLVRARDGSAGRWVRCPACNTKLAVPRTNDSPEPADSTSPLNGAESLLEKQEQRRRKRERPEKRRELSQAELWLMEHGVWLPLGVAVMALFGVLGLYGYAVESPTLLQIGAFMFLIGLGSFLYGRFELKRLVGVKDQEEWPADDSVPDHECPGPDGSAGMA